MRRGLPSSRSPGRGASPSTAAAPAAASSFPRRSTADRALTLSTTNAYAGARFRLTRTGSGAFNITHALKNLASNQWAEFVYDGSAWYLAAYGAL